MNRSTAQQLSFSRQGGEFAEYWKQTGRKVHGGVYSQGKRKTQRPVDVKKPLHVVLRSLRAKGSLSFLHPRHKTLVERIIRSYAQRFGVKVYRYANSGNHLHLVVRVKQRQALGRYLRTVTGLIARRLLKAKRGSPQGKFWEALAFTRIADWGKAYKTLSSYVLRNILEAAGVIPYRPRGRGSATGRQLIRASGK